MRVLRHFLMVFSVLLLLILGGFCWFTLSHYFESEMSFRRNLSFLNFEQAGYRLRDKLQLYSQIDRAADGASIIIGQEPAVILRQDTEDRPIFGQVPPDWSKGPVNHPRLQLRRLAGQLYLVREWENSRAVKWGDMSLGGGSYLFFWLVKDELIRQEQSIFSGQAWLMNLEGELLASTEENANVENLIQKPLVQKFIQSPLGRFQSYFDSKEHKGLYGFAMLMPETNMVLFSEVPLSAWTSPLLKTLGFAGLILLLGFCVLVIMARSFVMGLDEQCQRLARDLETFASGYFIPPEIDGVQLYSELEPLRAAIRYSTKRVRDKLTQLEREAHGGGAG